MKRAIVICIATVTFYGASSVRPALAHVVTDSACPKYAIEIAAFATCDGDHVAKHDGAASSSVDGPLPPKAPNSAQDTTPRTERVTNSKHADDSGFGVATSASPKQKR